MKRKKDESSDHSVFATSLLRFFAIVTSLGLVLLPSFSIAEVPSADDSTTAQSGSPEMITTFYATNRGRSEEASEEVHYDGSRGEPHYGRCVVEFSPIPLAGELASIAPFYLPRETNRVSILEEADRDVFWDKLTTAAGLTSSRSVIVFVHGYNYGFKRTCRMAAELQRTLSGKSTVVMLSWPSNALPTDYLPDQVDIEWSVPFLANFVADLISQVGPARVQTLAHSMGSRGVLFALQRLAGDIEQRPILSQFVLLAPDFDSETFVDLLPRLAPLVSGITLFASSNDTALVASRKVNGNPRLGEAGDYLTVADGIETIDVSPGGRYQILGHEYFYYHPMVVADLVELLGAGIPAGQRPTLRPRQRRGITYWEILEDAPH